MFFSFYSSPPSTRSSTHSSPPSAASSTVSSPAGSVSSATSSLLSLSPSTPIDLSHRRPCSASAVPVNQACAFPSWPSGPRLGASHHGAGTTSSYISDEDLCPVETEERRDLSEQDIWAAVALRSAALADGYQAGAQLQRTRTMTNVRAIRLPADTAAMCKQQQPQQRKRRPSKKQPRKVENPLTPIMESEA
ncbi:MAG: hypothetical protein M1829_004375 [Trizodia sp. TS-e1964]|nr:MAG: hypothetical protein M1829_004375 [Trizodia sp. TS-e1964]